MSLSLHNTMNPEFLLSRYADQLSPFLEEAGLDQSVFTDSEAVCSAAAWIKLLELAGKHLDDSIGLRFGNALRSTDLGVLGQALRSMDRLEDMLHGVSRYAVTRSQVEKIEISLSGNLVTISYQITDPTILPRRQDAELTLALFLSCIRELSASAVSPLRVDFEHAAPKDLRLHRETFHCPLHFNQDCNRLHFDKSLLDLPVHTANKRLLQALQPFLEEQRKLRSQPVSLLSEVSQAIAGELRLGRVGVVQVAESLHMSVRTLQRRLGELDLEFGELVEEVRRALALEYVGNSNYRLTDVALMLGYTEASSFSRAFRRWTDLTPREYRKKAGLESPSAALGACKA
ncbi:AraC-like transcriptional regulator QhpR [Zestomonas carbonaria]|uniref:HTH-type transcriptional regulator VirS n=1 Tax=Zestomonas carbonaria TaxID=2762745 RepID=A0A7U7I8N4_9GAMM|nr:AraC family transcriptional regulator [Pseudomonas carbonaria]CAD5107455.1 HTH-type transcriptional regulator VirS [Pseudomonas carbonaria]